MMEKQDAQAEHAAWQALIDADAYIPAVTDACYVADRRVWVAFDDGTQGEADLSDLLERSGKFGDLKNPGYFRKVFYDKKIQTIAWPNGLDLAPESLYRRVKKRQ